MLQKFDQHITMNFPFLKESKLLLAISGGLDSVVLMHLCNQLKLSVSLAHCNFKLRNEESDLDEEFVIKLSQILNNQIFTIHFDTENYAQEHKTSIQIAARNLRYQWFQELVSTHHFDYILTAHHADDNLETFLINLTRGSGLEGFTGIPEKNGNIIRPLLPFSRAEILEYAKENQLKWREDASNASTKYVRNKIRHQIVPILKEINPNLLDSFSKTLTHLQESQQMIEDTFEEFSKEIIKKNENNLQIDIKKLLLRPNSKLYLFHFLKKYHFKEWNNVYELLSAQSGKQLFSESHVLLKDRDYLFLSELKQLESEKSNIKIIENETSMSSPIQLNFEQVDSEMTKSGQSIFVEKSLLKYPLILRKWENGDYFYPTGMQGKKKVSKYFKDEKFSLFDKENTWLLCTAKNEVIWIVNHRQDRRFLASKETKNSLKITYKT
ncbi:MAG: tRNA lysidine(34) synthetase TilS [Flavobacteriia bacterium]|nr:tRNA lysidine(34) synthetase TilS [Flavobacteriia bacterium]OIP47348.1 MAG: tRNA lysidine(34) synthetase TilS [Flavobacteriaceae bacterium CG2_30_31_66]PIV95600.1 MAG: tRNA lysidine(34) synthetase TilS [Flavobacteriaceae bacterium CG17_big_fil_post_rev_8_21_14_2_50_31_13]PIX15338.1 MAG: tRNA lysidine(34) synthetase TilS [Flavobacteriaceae bacterium CG_4_8_14_3_um_filter_31_8]PIY15979.1 MAG: tRNA lysidine(34) synthetase TilS [Flavobacteriaceae bacterium CG_4_10_14_3_um_filter_31_253]PIZ11544